jgi:hypothetical protein
MSLASTVVIDGCLCEVQTQVQGLPPSDPARAGARTLIIRLTDERTTAYRTLTALENSVAQRPVRH